MKMGLIDGKMLKMGSRHTSCENPNEGPECNPQKLMKINEYSPTNKLVQSAYTQGRR